MIRTLVAVRSALMRAGLVALLAGERDIEVVGDTDRNEVLISAAQVLRPDVAVLDADMAGMDAFITVRRLHATVPSCRSLIMASEPSPADLREAVEARAAGFMRVQAPPEMLSEAVRNLAAGKKALDPDLAFAALNADPCPLTRREADVLRLAAEGARATEIAGELYLSVGTVRNYLSRAMGKTGARTRVEAIRIAGSSGWL